MQTDFLQQSNLTLDRLVDFSRVVDAGGCTQAAKAAGGAPGNFARKMKELEQCFGVTLLKPGVQRYLCTIQLGVLRASA